MSAVDPRSVNIEAESDRTSLKVLNDFAIELNRIADNNQLAWYVARDAVGALGFVDCVIYLLDHDRDMLRQEAVIGAKNPTGKEILNRLEIPVGQGITGHVAITGEAMIVDDVLEDERYIPDLATARAEICVPILHGDKVLGVIDCEHPEPGAFGQLHLELLTTVAAMTSSKMVMLHQDEVLRASERNYRAIVEDQTEMISRHSLDGLRTFANESYCRFHGKLKEELVGKSAYEGMPADDLKRLHEIYENLSPENPTGEFIVSFPGADGETIWQRWTKRAIFDEDMQVTEYQAVGHDITENKRAEMDRLSALEEAQFANRAKSDFLAAMSHELRTPLNAILGFSDVISREYMGSIGNKKYIEYAQDIRTSGEYLLSLVNDLLDISSIEAGKTFLTMAPMDIGKVIIESVNLIANEAQENHIELVTDVPDELPPVQADRRAIRQVILNLLTNALKFTAMDGRIAISALLSDEHLTIRVADTGIGIPADRLAELTKPFVRVQSDPYKPIEGWGLGLAITKSLIDLHGGGLEIESIVRVGTTISVRLPLNVGLSD